MPAWIHRRQLDAIEYLKAENRLLKERLGGRRLRLSDAERRRLARRAHALGCKALGELDKLVTPDTLMRWYRTLVAGKWTCTHRRGPGRPRTVDAVVQLTDGKLEGQCNAPSILAFMRLLRQRSAVN